MGIKLQTGNRHMTPAMRLCYGHNIATPAVVAIRADMTNVDPETDTTPLWGVDEIEGRLREAGLLQVVRFSEKDRQYVLEEYPIVSFLSKDKQKIMQVAPQSMKNLFMLGRRTFRRTQKELGIQRAEEMYEPIRLFGEYFDIEYSMDDMRAGKPTPSKLNELPGALPDVRLFSAIELTDLRFWLADKRKRKERDALSYEDKRKVLDVLYGAKRKMRHARSQEEKVQAQIELEAAIRYKHKALFEREVTDLAEGIRPEFVGRHSLDEAVEKTEDKYLDAGMVEITGNPGVKTWPVATYADITPFKEWGVYSVEALGAKTEGGHLAMGLDGKEWKGTGMLPDLRTTSKQITDLHREWKEMVEETDLKKNYKEVLKGAHSVDAICALINDDKDYFLKMKGIGEKSVDEIISALVLHPKFPKIPEEYSVVQDRYAKGSTV